MNTEPASSAVDAEVGFHILLRPPVIVDVGGRRQAMKRMRDERRQQPLLAEVTETINHTEDSVSVSETRDKQKSNRKESDMVDCPLSAKLPHEFMVSGHATLLPWSPVVLYGEPGN